MTREHDDEMTTTGASLPLLVEPPTCLHQWVWSDFIGLDWSIFRCSLCGRERAVRCDDEGEQTTG